MPQEREAQAGTTRHLPGNEPDINKLPHLGYGDDFDIQKCLFIYNNHLSIMASRGWPYSCSYCNNHALRRNLCGTYVRFRSVENVIEEIEVRIKQYYDRGFRYFYFFDDTFILHKDYVLQFCTQFKEKGFHRLLRWNVNIRANLVSNELMRTLKDAGCYQVRLGVESGNQYIRNSVYNRGMTNQEIFDAVRIIKKNNLQLRLYFMAGAPQETIEMMQESLQMAQKLNADEIFFGVLYPLAGRGTAGIFGSGGAGRYQTLWAGITIHTKSSI